MGCGTAKSTAEGASGWKNAFVLTYILKSKKPLPRLKDKVLIRIRLDNMHNILYIYFNLSVGSYVLSFKV